MATKIDELPSNESNLHAKPVQPQFQDNLPTNNPTVEAQTYNPQPESGSQPVNQMSSASITPGFNLSPDDLSKIVTGLQKASQSNLTSLPSRDIPTSHDRIVMDEQAYNTNYIPKESSNDYIKDGSSYENLLKQQFETDKLQRENLDFFDEIKTPILLSILFFIFQLPIIRRTLLDKIPSLFLTDGNMSFNGLMMMSILYGTMYYLINKFLVLNV